MEKQKECVMGIIGRLSAVAEDPCKKKLQKIVYLIEERDIDWGFDYKIHIYGPYSADLDYAICELKAERKLDIEYTKKGHILKCIDVPASNNFPEEVEEIIDSFGTKSSSELELITTALFAQRHIVDKNDENIILAVRKIKGRKFSLEKIVDAIQLLKDTNFICA